jgi:xylan 1,4-beta-xylosidase
LRSQECQLPAISCRRHGRLVEAADGSWWMTAHSYENGFRGLGRQLLLLPVEWNEDGWFRVPAGISAEKPIAMLNAGTGPGEPLNLSDEFTSPELRPHWQFWREFDRSRFQTGAGRLVLAARGTSLAASPPLTCITGDHSYTIEVDIECEPGCEAGLLLHYNPDYRLPGEDWQRTQESAEVASINHNVLGGFLSLRPALYACGSGHAVFRSFRYTNRLVI